MSTDCFIAMDQVPGEAHDEELAGAIEVFGWNWGASWRGDQAAGSPRGVADVRHFTFEHNVDTATAGLLSRCVTGLVIPNATLTQRRAGGRLAQVFLEIKFKQVRIVDVSMVMSSASAGLATQERVSFAFESASLDYKPQSKSGADKSGRHNFSWQGVVNK